MVRHFSSTKTVIMYPTRAEEPQDVVIHLLQTIARKLQELLPDPALSPLERVERLARVIPDSIQYSAHHLTARRKLTQIRLRLSELVPQPELTECEKIACLVEKVHQILPGETTRLFEKLERIGDCRMLDNGGVPFPNWTPTSLYWPHLREGECV